MNGTIVRLITDKGFGFILGEDGVERFFHRSGFITRHGFDSVKERDKVVFEPVSHAKGPRAESIGKHEW